MKPILPAGIIAPRPEPSFSGSPINQPAVQPVNPLFSGAKPLAQDAFIRQSAARPVENKTAASKIPAAEQRANPFANRAAGKPQPHTAQKTRSPERKKEAGQAAQQKVIPGKALDLRELIELLRVKLAGIQQQKQLIQKQDTLSLSSLEKGKALQDIKQEKPIQQKLAKAEAMDGKRGPDRIINVPTGGKGG